MELRPEKIDLAFGKLDTSISNLVLAEVSKHIKDNSRTIFNKFLASDYGNVWGEGKEVLTHDTLYRDTIGINNFTYFETQKGRTDGINLPLGIIAQVSKALGIDMSWVDSIYINIYREGHGAFPHIDHSEGKYTISCPIVSLTLGYGSSFTLSEDYNYIEEKFNKEMYDLSSKKTFFLGHGDIIAFGGKYRLSAHETGDTLHNATGQDFLPLEVGTRRGEHLDTLTEYRINLTFRKSNN